jgi:sulfonate transport system substrate-binding protein
MNFRRSWLFALAVGLLTATTASAGTEIRIAYPGTGIDGRPFAGGGYVAVAHVHHLVEDEFKDRPDVKVTWTFFRGAGPAVNESLAAGQIDFAALGDLPAIVGKSRGLNTRFLLAASTHDPIYLAVDPKSNINTIEDLKGRKVSQFRGTNLQIDTGRALEAHKLTEKDIQFVSLDLTAAIAALLSGNVEAVFGGPEYLDLASRGLVKIIYSTKNEDPRFGRNSAVYVTEAFEKAHPDETQKVVNALVKAARFTADEANRDKLFEIWAKSGLSASSFAQDREGERLSYRVSPLIDDYIVARYKSQTESAKAYGLIKRPVDIDAWLEPKYLKQALKDLRLEHFWPAYDANGDKISDGEVEKTKASGN